MRNNNMDMTTEKEILKYRENNTLFHLVQILLSR